MTFIEAVSVVMDQIDYYRLLGLNGEDVSNGTLPKLVKVMADMYIKLNTMVFPIEGENMTAWDIKAVYRLIDTNGITDLIDELNSNPNAKNVNFIRTGLYRAGLLSPMYIPNNNIKTAKENNND